MTGQNTAATGTLPAHDGGAIDVDAWRRRIRADAFGRYHYEMGIAIQAEGNLPAAVQHLQTAIDTDPTLVDSYFHLGQIHQSQGRTAEAEALYARARAQDPGFPAGTLVRLALRALDRNGEGDGEQQALDLAQQALTHDPTQREAPWIGALVQARRGRLDAAAALRAGGQGGSGGEEAADLAWRFYRLAEVWREAGRPAADTAEAAACALALDPDLPQALGLSAVLLEEAGQPAAAEPLLRRAVALQPGLPWLRAYLGSTLISLSRAEEAVAELRTAATELPDNFWVHGRLGIALFHARSFGDAAAALRTSLGLRGEVPWVLGYLGAALRELGQTAESAAVLERALRHEPASPWLLALLAETRAAEARFDEAAALYRQALDRDPSMGWVKPHLGNVLFKAGRMDEAAAALADAAAHTPEPSTLGMLGLAHLALRRGDDAARTFRQALDIQPAPWLHEGLAAALLMAGHTQDAAGAFAAGWAAGMDPMAAFARLWLSLPADGLPDGLTALQSAVPDASWPSVLLGLTRLAAGDTAAAVTVLKTAAETGAEPAWTGRASVFLGLAQTVAGEAAAGLASVERGIAAAGAGYRTYRGVPLQALGRLNEAEAEHRATLAAIPGDTAAGLHLALTLDALGRTDEGRTLLRQAESLHPGRVRAQIRLLPSWAGPVLDRLRHG